MICEWCKKDKPVEDWIGDDPSYVGFYCDACTTEIALMLIANTSEGES